MKKKVSKSMCIVLHSVAPVIGALLMSTPCVKATVMPLPQSLANKAVYYIKSQQIDEMSCGYNALFNI